MDVRVHSQLLQHTFFCFHLIICISLSSCLLTKNYPNVDEQKILDDDDDRFIAKALTQTNNYVIQYFF